MALTVSHVLMDHNKRQPFYNKLNHMNINNILINIYICLVTGGIPQP